MTAAAVQLSLATLVATHVTRSVNGVILHGPDAEIPRALLRGLSVFEGGVAVHCIRCAQKDREQETGEQSEMAAASSLN